MKPEPGDFFLSKIFIENIKTKCFPFERNPWQSALQAL